MMIISSLEAEHFKAVKQIKGSTASITAAGERNVFT